MKYKRPLIIGVGTIGSIICKKISENTSYFDKLTIIDYDIVKEKNLQRSIFTSNDIGKNKVDVIYNKLSNKIMIDKFNLKFNENFSNSIYDTDLIIDCRDFLYSRRNIDVRLFIFDKILIMDCRKNINYDNVYEGTYFWNVTFNEISILVDKFIEKIKNNELELLIKNKMVTEVGLSDDQEIRLQNIKKNVLVDNDNKISNPQDIYHMNNKITKQKNVTLKFFNINTEVKTKTIDISNSNISNILNEINSLIPRFDNNNYLLIFEDNEILIIPETGAA